MSLPSGKIYFLVFTTHRVRPNELGTNSEVVNAMKLRLDVQICYKFHPTFICDSQYVHKNGKTV